MFLSVLVNEDFLIRVAVLAIKYRLNINQLKNLVVPLTPNWDRKKKKRYSNGSVSIVRYKYGIEIRMARRRHELEKEVHCGHEW